MGKFTSDDIAMMSVEDQVRAMAANTISLVYSDQDSKVLFGHFQKHPGLCADYLESAADIVCQSCDRALAVSLERVTTLARTLAI